MKIAVLLSVGRHPVSGRAGPARLDAQAIALASALGGETAGLHAGDAPEAVRDYLGHGLAFIEAIETPGDPLPALVAALGDSRPDLILAGRRAQGGKDSGLLPYALAAALGRGIVADACGLRRDGNRIVVEQALPRGARRLVTACLPLVVTVHAAAPAPHPFAFAAARRGVLATRPGPAGAVTTEAGEERPYRRRPRLIGQTGGTAAERLQAATRNAAGGGRTLVDPDPDAAARAIIAHLEGLGLLRPDAGR